VAVAVLCLPFADFEVVTLDPWGELARMAGGLLRPSLQRVEAPGRALLQTGAFALLGVGTAAIAGFGLALLFHRRPVRWACAVARSIHELFWALLFLPMLGLHPLTGLLALAVPYAAILAKVYSEILEEAQPAALRVLHAPAHGVSAFFYARLPEAWAQMSSYTLYRLECGLRSSAVLGFVGLPTLGFHLQSAFRQGHYPEASALLIGFFVLVGTLRTWMRPRLLWLYVPVSVWLLASPTRIDLGNVVRFLTHDIVPSPLRAGGRPLLDALWALGSWAGRLVRTQALPGALGSLVVTQIALVTTAFLTLALFPLAARRFAGPRGRYLGHMLLVVMRSTPEYVLAYVFLQLWGPSMLPAVVALSLHNAAILGHLTARHADQVPLRPDAPRGLDLYAYEVLPQVYGPFLALLFYRWEVIFRETAIFGILGIRTLGFYVDSAISEIRFDRALLLILFGAGINLGIDAVSRRLRGRLRLSRQVEVG
jgi:phosphonate transport system permease protein